MVYFINRLVAQLPTYIRQTQHEKHPWFTRDSNPDPFAYEFSIATLGYRDVRMTINLAKYELES
jgi:hypothetical protein